MARSHGLTRRPKKTHALIRRFGTPYEYAVEPSSTTVTPEQSFRFLGVPPEVRNRIYKECILLARTYIDTKTEREYRPIKVSFFKSMIEISDLRALPLLLTSKQVYEEMVGMVYSQFEINMRIRRLSAFRECRLARRNRKCNEFSTLFRWPNIQQFIRVLDVSITLPTSRSFLNRRSTGPVHLQTMIDFIVGCKALKKLEILIRFRAVANSTLLMALYGYGPGTWISDLWKIQRPDLNSFFVIYECLD